MSKPEYQGPPEQFYDQEEARKYTTNSRIRKIQYELSQRAYELLELPEEKGQCLLLDIGCGSGLSGEVLTENGHEWIGVDISRHMLDVAREENEAEGDLLQLDMGGGLPFRAGVFDGAISVSAVQWLCHSNSKREDPRRRLLHFFESLFACLSRSARAVFQFYPENQQQCDLISQQALKAGFQGGLVIDHPDSPKQKKVFLVLSAGKEAAIVHQLPMKSKKRREERNEEEEDWNSQNGQEEEEEQSSHIQIIGRRGTTKWEAGGRRGMKTKSARKVIDKKRRKKERRMAKAAKKRKERNGEMEEEGEENDDGMEM